MLYLIRHAESTSNLLNSSTGSIFDELSFEGRQRCHDLKIFSKSLKEKLNLKIVCTSAARSLETGVLLFGSNIKIDCDWLETDGGYLQNIPEKYVQNFFEIPNNSNRVYPNGESNIFMKDRVIKSFERYLKFISNENIAIVTHLGPILAIKEHLKVEAHQIQNLDGIIVTKENNKIKLFKHEKLRSKYQIN